MSEVYEQEFYVRWSDLDPNMHLRHTAYNDMCATTRLSYLASLGFDMVQFRKHQMGPVLFSEHLNFHKEVFSGDKVRVNVRISGLSEDGRKWSMRQEMFRVSDNQLAATLDVKGAWFSVVTRKLTPAPDILQNQIVNQPKTDDFQII